MRISTARPNGYGKGAERRVAGIERIWGNVRLEDANGNALLWQPCLHGIGHATVKATDGQGRSAVPWGRQEPPGPSWTRPSPIGRAAGNLLQWELTRDATRRWSQKMRRTIASLVAAGLVVGCASLDQPNEFLGPYPYDYKSTIREHALRSFFDPYSIRDAAISEPVRSHTGEPNGWLVCLEANAKNRMGGYTGLSRTAYYVRAEGQVVGTETGDYGNYICTGRTLTGMRTLTFAPWPELEQLQHQ